MDAYVVADEKCLGLLRFTIETNVKKDFEQKETGQTARWAAAARREWTRRLNGINYYYLYVVTSSI